MKTKLMTTLLATLLLAACNQLGSNEQDVPQPDLPIDNSGIVFQKADNPPVFEGGVEGYYAYIQQNLHYPEEAKEKGLEGRVYVALVVNTDGSVSDVEVLKGVDPLLDNEAKRVVADSPRWQPASHNGKIIRFKLVLPIVFKLK